MSRLSVVIATRDRPALLADCLATLADQTTGDFDVVVVDDGSDVDLAPVVEAAGDRVPMRLVRQEPSGLSAARNTGAAETSGDVLAYLDDDTLVDPGWAEALLGTVESFGCSAVAGRVSLDLPGPAPPWLSPGLRRYLAECERGAEARWLEDDEIPVGANFAVTRSDFERVGAFPTDLGRQGGTLLSNEEVAFFRDLRSAGGRFAYAPAAHVRHRIPEARLTASFMVERAHAQGLSDAAMSPDGWTARDRVRHLVRTGRAIPVLAKNIVTGRGTVGGRAWLAYCRGLGSGQRAKRS